MTTQKKEKATKLVIIDSGEQEIIQVLDYAEFDKDEHSNLQNYQYLTFKEIKEIIKRNENDSISIMLDIDESYAFLTVNEINYLKANFKA